MLKNKYFLLISISSVMLIMDQVTKILIRENIPFRRTVEVIPGLFRLVHVENEGAAWGILSDASYRIPFFIVATTIAFVVIGIYFSKLTKDQLWLAAALSFILGGAIGNFIDRLVYQSVTDFLEFYISAEPVSSWLIRTFRSNRWPSFNIADVAIVAGLFMIMYDMLVLEGRRARALTASGQAERDEANGGGGMQTTGEGGYR